MKSYYFTTAPNHPLGSGFWIVLASNSATAREIMFREKGIKWSHQYTDLADIHPLDNKCHGILQ